MPGARLRRRLAALAVTAALTGCTITAPLPPLPSEASHDVTRVFYVTDRNDIPAAPSEQRYGAERGELACGTIDVSIPRDHRAGILETPSLRHLEFRPERDKHVVLLSVTRPPADFYAHLRQTVERSTGHDAFVLVAPDIDAGVFRQRARQILGTARHVAL